MRDDGPAAFPSFGIVDESDNGALRVDGRVDYDYGQDGAGSIALGNENGGADVSFVGVNNLTSNGVAVAIVIENGAYVGRANGAEVFRLTLNNNGNYTFQQFEQIDHPNTQDANDNVGLEFTYTVTDSDGDTDQATIDINILDDGPVAYDDFDTTTDNSTATGNVITGAGVTTADADDFGYDDGGRLFSVEGQNLNANGAAIQGQWGTLTINPNGSYTYQPILNQGVDGVRSDVFTYTIVDGDGDSANATLTIETDFGADDVPIVTNARSIVDETGGFDTVSGRVDVDFGSDSVGASIQGNGQANIGNLTSNGQAINVTFNNGTYTGSAGGQTVFTLSVNNNGNYTFQQFEQIDHPNSSNPNDAVDLVFGVQATDGDGDSTNGQIRITVRDDGPEAGFERISIDEDNDVGRNFSGDLFRDYGADDLGGDVFAGGLNGQAVFSFDGAQNLTSNGDPISVSLQNDTYIGRANGSEVFRLEVGDDGEYNFRLSQTLDHPDPNNDNEIISLRFGYTVEDGDGDRDVGHFEVRIADDGSGTGCTGRVIIGTPDTDVLIGTDCDDIIDGNGCDDVMIGNDGADTFVIADIGSHNKDVISDYDYAEGDVIDLSELIDDNSYSGNLADYLSFNDNLSMLYVDPTGGNNASSHQEAVIISGVGGGDNIAIKIGDQLMNVNVDEL